MKNVDEPAFPKPALEHDSDFGDGASGLYLDYKGNSGLTKREYFAARAMQGILSNTHLGNILNNQKISESALGLADALLAELEKPDIIDLKPCPKCGKPRGEDTSGCWICPCPHCGDEIPF